jgi:nitric oxide dioxygenase
MEHPQILQLIHQTAPALVADGDQLTKDFYQHLFTHNPQLRHTFNMANQANGKQARSLFEAIVLFVTKYDQLETLGADARRIAAKHVSVDVRPEEYGSVGASLLATIQERLGLAATPEVMKAWELAYGRIAQVLIGLEAATYQQQRDQPGGWNGFKPFVVERVVEETPEIKSFYLVPQDGSPLPVFRAGQFVTLAVHLPHHPYRQLRQYSLSDAPGKPYFRITVKREPRHSTNPDALVSNHLHTSIEAGSILAVHAPTGEFCLTPNATAPLVLIAGGVGITPLMAMLEQLAHEALARRVLLIHAVRDAHQHVFHQRLQQLAQQHQPLRFFTIYQAAPFSTAGEEAPLLPLECTNGLLQAQHLEHLLTPALAGADYYCCGPVGFMHHVRELLAQRGVTTGHFEVFGPTQELAPQAPAAVNPPPQCPAHRPQVGATALTV